MQDDQLQRYLNMLKSSDANQRRQAIVALGKSADKRALKPLSEAYKTDPDESLRQLALKAGRFIQKQTAEMPISSETISYEQPPVGKTKTEDVPDWMKRMEEDAPKKKVVTQQDRDKAKRLKERAMNAAVEGKMGEVVDYIADAVDLDPDMEKDGMLMGLLAQATGMEPNAALKEIKRIIAEDAAKGKKRRSSDKDTWNETINFVLELAIWVIVLALFGAVSFYLTIDDQFWRDQEAAAASPEEVEILQDGKEFWDERGILASLILGGVYGVVLVGVSLFMSFIAWFVGFNFMDGQGFLYPFLTAMLRVTTVVFFISTTAGFLGQYFSPTSDIGIILGFAPLLLGIGIIAWTIGRVHKFGTAMGCANMVGTIIACGVLNCACSFILTIGSL